jgi:hypothetical protein
MPYEQRVDRNHPGCILFLVDQSASMSEEIPSPTRPTKAGALCDAINVLLYELVLRCIKDPGEGPRHYYDVGVVGYGDTVGPALGGTLAGQALVSIADVGNHPLRVDDRKRPEGDAPTRRGKFPVWFDPKAANGTPMGEAIDLAGSIVATWVARHTDSFPPIVINISDGAATDGDPRVWADRLRSLSTQDGSVLFFNVNLSALAADTMHFPATEAGLNDEYARTLFDMSSPLPKFMRDLATQQGLPAVEGARGFVFNADIVSVIAFLQIGTATHHLAGERTV